uniref:Uncharacterized protein n=1 Tax=Anopheles quadriannulatus TaxID=34691 RepID=A0A182XT76_ANOQN
MHVQKCEIAVRR